MNPSLATLSLTVIATAALQNNRAVSQAGAYPDSGGLAFGITRSDAAIGDPVTVDVQGTAVATAGAAFAKDVPLMAGEDGKLVDLEDGGTAVARSMEAATADGQLVEVLLVPSAGPAAGPAVPA
jgi:hypothetical protein